MVCGLKYLIGLLAMMSLMFPAGVFAQEVAPEAMESFHRGTVHYENQEWAQAGVAFRRAFEISGMAIFLFNAARAAHQNENLSQAHNYYERALAIDEEGMALPADLRARAEGYREEVHAKLEEERARELAAREASRVEEVRWGRRGWLGVGASAAGAALLVTSAAMGVSASNGIDELGELNEEELYQERRTQIERTQGLGKVALWGGSALLASGLGLLIWELVTVETQNVAPRLGFVPRRDGILATWEVTF